MLKDCETTGRVIEMGRIKASKEVAPPFELPPKPKWLQEEEEFEKTLVLTNQDWIEARSDEKRFQALYNSVYMAVKQVLEREVCTTDIDIIHILHFDGGPVFEVLNDMERKGLVSIKHGCGEVIYIPALKKLKKEGD